MCRHVLRSTARRTRHQRDITTRGRSTRKQRALTPWRGGRGAAVRRGRRTTGVVAAREPIAACLAGHRAVVRAALLADLAVLDAIAQRRRARAHVAHCDAARRVDGVDATLLQGGAGRLPTNDAVGGAPAASEDARLILRTAVLGIATERAVRVVGSTASDEQEDRQRDAAHAATLSCPGGPGPCALHA
jgi:hypothetical protein